jgi:uncharacterized membrane protein YcaP (DUF421 family)
MEIGTAVAIPAARRLARTDMDGVQRILLGEDPLAFLLEVAARTVIIYVLLMVIVRMLGKRMTGQLSNLELAVMITLGAVVSPPMQISERGLLPGLMLLVVVLGCQRGIAAWTARSRRGERLVFGHGTTLVEDGRMLLPAMLQAHICHEQLFGVLRAKGIRHLGEVRRVYLETAGIFSVLRAPEPKPGLAIVPVLDERMSRDLPKAGVCVCMYCGQLLTRGERACPSCGSQESKPAVAAGPESMRQPPRPTHDGHSYATDA